MNYKTLFLAKQWSLVMVFLVICSCSTTPMKGYTGPDLPANQTALIRAVRATNLETCDNVKLSRNEVIVLPGTHNIEVTWRGGVETYSNEIILVTFKAEAGHIYEISAEDIPGGKWSVFATDKTTGNRVGTTRPSTRNDEELLAYINRQMQFGTNNDFLWFQRGLALGRMKKYEEALKAYDKVIEIKPNDERAWNNKGQAFFSLGKYEDAIKCTDRAIELKANYEIAWSNKGEILLYMKKYEDAIKACDKAIELKPTYLSPWIHKGRALSETKRYEEAIKILDKAIELKSDDGRVWHYKAVALSNVGKTAEATRCYDKAKELGFVPEK